MKRTLLLMVLLSLPAVGASKRGQAAGLEPALASSPAEGQLAAVDPGSVAKEVRHIPIDENRANKVYRIRTAPGLQAILEFPEGFASPPSCGDCVDGSAPAEVLQASPSLFVIQTFAADNYIAVKPLRFSREDGGDGPPSDEFLTTVTVRLVSKLTITLQVEYAHRALADARVVFSFPHRQAESEYVRQQVEKARSELEASYAERISAGATRALLEALLEPPTCTLLGRLGREDNLRLELTQVCRVGSRVYVRFTLENRGRAPIALGDVQLYQRVGREGVPIEEAQYLLSKQELAFKDVAKGVIGFELAEGEEPAKSYELHVIEGRASGREVVGSFGL
jgi:hypothetical protein